MFGYNESLKEKFPISKYLKAPELEDRKRKIERGFDLDNLKNLDNVNGFKRVLENQSSEEFEKLMPKDIKHPKDSSRSYFKDTI